MKNNLIQMDINKLFHFSNEKDFIIYNFKGNLK